MYHLFLSVFHLSETQIKKFLQFHGLDPETVWSDVQCSNITPGKTKAVSNIFGYALQLNKCLAPSVACSYICLYMYAIQMYVQLFIYSRYIKV